MLSSSVLEYRLYVMLGNEEMRQIWVGDRWLIGLLIERSLGVLNIKCALENDDFYRKVTLYEEIDELS